MKSFLFEYYGYYPKEIVDNSFILDGWNFKLIDSDITSEQISMIEKYITILNDTFFNKGPFIIKNKLNNNLSSLNDTNYVLIAIFSTTMTFYDLLTFHKLFYNEQEYVELDKILEAWKERVENVEKKLHSKLRVDSVYYKHNLEVTMFSVGLAINAMQYLSDIINNYENKLYGVTIVHKRLKNLDSFDFFNPFNFIVEHPLKDICLLFQNDYISFEEFKSLLLNYELNIVSATFVIARLLYRVDVFDFIETKKDLENQNQKIVFNLEKEIYKIKKAYSLLKEMYSIRPIDWLEESL